MNGPLHRPFLKRMWFIVSLLSAAWLQGCLTFQDRPLKPESTASGYEARGLTDVGLKSFMTQNTSSISVWPPAVWDFKFLTLAAFYYDTDLDVARAQWAVSKAAVQTAEERPNPSIAIGPEYASNPEPGFASWIFGVSFDIPIETAGKRRFRITQSHASAEAARLHLAQAAWMVRSRIRAALVCIYAAHSLRDVLESQDQKIRENFQLSEKRSGAGFISPFALSQAKVLAGRTELALADAEHQESDGRHRLAQTIGIPVRALEDVPLLLTNFSRPGNLNLNDLTTLRAQALLRRPDLLESLAMYAASQAALQLEIARQYPDLHIGPGYLYDQGTRKWGLQVSGILPVFNRNRGAIAEASAKRDEAAAQFLALQDHVLHEIDQAIADYQSSLQKLTLANTLLADQMRQDARLQKLLQPGDVSRLTLFRTQLDLDSTRLLASDAKVQVLQAVGALEDALGHSLEGSGDSLPNPEINTRSEKPRA